MKEAGGGSGRLKGAQGGEEMADKACGRLDR